MRLANPYVRTVVLAYAALAAAGCQTAKKPVALLPPTTAPALKPAAQAPAPAPAAATQPAAAPQPAQPAPAQKPAEASSPAPPSDPVADLIAHVEKEYQTGL